MRPSLMLAYLAMLPRLQAEESLRHVAERQAASADVKAAHRERLISTWQREAAGESYTPVKPDERQLTSRMAALGIKVVTTPKKEDSGG